MIQKKEETILDPACGTAGFLISAYKHILNQNYNKPLTPDEKKKLMQNLVGYDISPDMVRLSLVNMYLHGFPKPKIDEYDTLTSEEKWDDDFDVIMANPPFMTPKGGIRPHKRFSIKANRSEVLFVDYIIEHIKESGKAGVIVPDGIVSNKNSSAYVNLRQKLVQDGYLYAVVSLHAGVFKPYADVKTSILLLNKNLSRTAKSIAFVEIENDGFERGNRKRPIAENDLPHSIELISKFKNIISDKEKIDSFSKHNSKIFIVDKKTIAEDGDYILRSNKYRASIKARVDLPIEKLQNHIVESNERNNLHGSKPIVFTVTNNKGLVDAKEFFNTAVQSENLSKYKIVLPGSIVFNPARANVGSLALNDTGITGLVSPMYSVFRIREDSDLVPEYLYYLLKSKLGIEQINLLSSGAVRQTLKFNDLKELEIPIPPSSFQNSFKKDHSLIKYLRLAVNNYEPYIKIDPEWKEVKLIDYFNLIKGDQPIEKTIAGEYHLVTTSKSLVFCDRYQFDGEAICVPLISSAGHGKATINRIYYVKGKFAVGSILMAVLPKNSSVSTNFFYFLFSQEKDNLFTNLMYGTSNVSFKIDDCKNVMIPMPNIEKQKEILRQIEKEREQIDRNKEIINLFEIKTEDKINEVWGF
ncbi:N-6 DNA methylase [Actinomycetota bacterium]